MTDFVDEEMDQEGQDQFDLSQWDDEYDQAPVEDRDFEPVPDGKYQVAVDRVELTTAQTSGKPMLKWALKIIAPNHVGRLLWRNNMIASPDNIRWLKNDLNVCGMKLGKLSELPAHLEELLDVKIEVTVRTRGENQNVYFNRLIDTGKPGDGGIDREIEQQAEEVFR
ncbi:MAG TPA: DUF669 domain-containing protein [Geobacteraceae bacterium]|nr:DUF669 domain-containing protein [Geobacteraceae bacterium]